MHKPSGLGMVVGTIGFAVLLASSIAHAQIEGALQFRPPSVGEDAQPLPPARMVPQQLRLSRPLARRHRSVLRAAGAPARRNTCIVAEHR